MQMLWEVARAEDCLGTLELVHQVRWLLCVYSMTPVPVPVHEAYLCLCLSVSLLLLLLLLSLRPYDTLVTGGGSELAEPKREGPDTAAPPRSAAERRARGLHLEPARALRPCRLRRQPAPARGRASEPTGPRAAAAAARRPPHLPQPRGHNRRGACAGIDRIFVASI